MSPFVAAAGTVGVTYHLFGKWARFTFATNCGPGLIKSPLDRFSCKEVMQAGLLVRWRLGAVCREVVQEGLPGVVFGSWELCPCR